MLFRRHYTGFFPVQYCLESLGQHWTEFLHVQGCSNRIAALLNRTFSCAMLSGSSSRTLHFTCGMFSKEYQNNIQQDLFLCNFV